MISLQNPGLIDLEVITTMGVSVKENDNSIGMFGTGLKYAISVFLREGIEFTLYRGRDKYEFYTEEADIRGESFDKCYMSGPYDVVDLGFVTHMGFNWDVWQAYREIHSNCLDENGTIVNDMLQPCNDCTTFCIDMDINPDTVFLNKQKSKCLFKNKSIEIYEGKSDYIFYKGIRAKDLKDPSIYTYNILQESDLTEDRCLSYDWQVQELIGDTVAQMEEDHKDLLTNIVTAKRGTFERDVKPDPFMWSAPSNTFKQVVKSNDSTNSNFKALASKYEPKKEPTPVERREEFILALTKLCDSYKVTLRDNETAPTTYELFGGILMVEGTDENN